MSYYVVEGIIEKPEGTVFFGTHDPVTQDEYINLIETIAIKHVATVLNDNTNSWKIYFNSDDDFKRYNLEKWSWPSYVARTEYNDQNGINAYTLDQYTIEELPVFTD